MEVEALVRPVVEGAGLELVDVSYAGDGGRRTLRVTVDRDEGIDVDTIAAVSDKIARRLDLEDFGDGRYELEVSSPGIERALRTPAQFRRALDARVAVTTAAPVDGARRHAGTLVSVHDDGIGLTVDGAERRLPYDAITSARTVADWGAELNGTHA